MTHSTGTHSDLTPDEFDMLLRIALAERFTSPTKPSPLTIHERMRVIAALERRGLVQRHPTGNLRLNDAGRKEIKRAEQRILELCADYRDWLSANGYLDDRLQRISSLQQRVRGHREICRCDSCDELAQFYKGG